MKAIVSTEAGKIEFKEVPIPVPEFGEVLVQVQYAPVNPSDVYFALRDYAAPGVDKVYPYVNGLEGSGVVVGSGGGPVANLYHEFEARIAFATGGGGTWAEYVCVPAMKVVPLPDNVDFKSGSAAIVNPLTVVGFLEIAQNGGHHTLVHTAANSALGMMLLRACNSLGLTVIGVVRGEKNEKILVEDFGHPAELVVRSDVPDFENNLKQIIDKKGATVAFDAIGGSMSGKIYNAMPAQSETYVYGLLSGEEPDHALFDNVNKPHRFDKFHLKAWLDEGGLPRVLSVISRGRSMLHDELKTEFSEVLEFEEKVLERIYEYNRHQKGGKLVMKIGEK